MRQPGFTLASLLLLAAVQLLGGPPWTALYAIAIVSVVFTDCRTSSLALIASSMAWVVLSRLTANRQLFFPFTMSLASIVFVQLCDRTFWRGVFGGIAVLAAFFFVRIQQHASVRALYRVHRRHLDSGIRDDCIQFESPAPIIADRDYHRGLAAGLLQSPHLTGAFSFNGPSIVPARGLACQVLVCSISITHPYCGTPKIPPVLTSADILKNPYV